MTPHTLRVFFLVACLFFSASSNAADRSIGDWIYGELESNQGNYAATVNDSSGVFGQYCFAEQSNCVWLLSISVDCEEGSEYPVLVNSDGGAAHHTILCFKVKAQSRYAFKDFEAIDSVVRGATRLGIAFPMKSGQFQVSRFSLTGANVALDAMRAAALAKASRSTRDTRL